MMASNYNYNNTSSPSIGLNTHGYGRNLRRNGGNAPHTYSVPRKMVAPWDTLPYIPYSYKLLVPLRHAPSRQLSTNEIQKNERMLDKVGFVKLPQDVTDLLYEKGMQYEVHEWRKALTGFRDTLHHVAYPTGSIILSKSEIQPLDPTFVLQPLQSLDDRLRDFWGPFHAAHMTKELLLFYQNRAAQEIYDDWEAILWPPAAQGANVYAGIYGNSNLNVNPPLSGHTTDDITMTDADYNLNMGTPEAAVNAPPLPDTSGNLPEIPFSSSIGGTFTSIRSSGNKLFVNIAKDSGKPLWTPERGSQMGKSQQVQSQILPPWGNKTAPNPQTPAPAPEAVPTNKLPTSALKSGSSLRPSSDQRRRVQFEADHTSSSTPVDSVPGFRTATSSYNRTTKEFLGENRIRPSRSPPIRRNRPAASQHQGSSNVNNTPRVAPGDTADAYGQANMFNPSSRNSRKRTRDRIREPAYEIAPDDRDELSFRLPRTDVYHGLRVFDKWTWDWLFWILFFIGCYNIFSFLSFVRDVGSAGLGSVRVVQTEFNSSPIWPGVSIRPTNSAKSGKLKEKPSMKEDNWRPMSNYEREREQEIEWEKMAYLLEIVEDGKKSAWE